MNAFSTLRDADPGKHLPTSGLDAGAEDLLRAIVTSDDRRDSVPADTSASGGWSRRRRFEWRPIIVTGVVAAAVVTAAVISIQSVPHPTRSPAAASPTPDVSARLDEAVTARIPATARDRPALTWTEAALGAQGGMVDLSGRKPAIIAACTGGGTITVDFSNRPDIHLDCGRFSVLGPIDLLASGGSSASGSTGIGVNSTGTPHYVVRLITLDK